MAVPSLDEFTAITMEIVREDGIACYLPTLIGPGDDDLVIVEGIPEGVNHRRVVQDVAEREGFTDGEFVFAVRSGPGELTIGLRRLQGADFRLLKETADGYQVTSERPPDWWRL